MATPDPRIAVVIATRNRAGLLNATLIRLRNLPERPRVVVVDNASTDCTVRVARDFGPHVDLVQLSRNVGAAARNVGVAFTSAPYVAFADDDSWYAPGALARAADLFDAHPRLGLIAACVRVGLEKSLDETCAAMAC